MASLRVHRGGTLAGNKGLECSGSRFEVTSGRIIRQGSERRLQPASVVDDSNPQQIANRIALDSDVGVGSGKLFGCSMGKNVVDQLRQDMGQCGLDGVMDQ